MLTNATDENTSVEVSTQSADGGVLESLAEFRAGQEEFDRFFRDVFAEFDAILSEFTRSKERWQQQRRQIETDLARQAMELEQQRAELHAQRDQLEREGGHGDEKTLDQLRQARSERDTAVHERELLETELEAVRARAAELAEALEKQRIQAAEQQSQWIAELRQQRALLTTLTARLTEQKLAAARAPAASETDGDLALDSVVAQFEMLQKDVARRRTAASEARS